MSEDTTPKQPVFVRGNDQLDRLLSDPLIASDVAAAHADAEEMDRAYAMNLAMVRKAAQLTQAEVARKLGVGQAAISRLEGREDMLLSTLYDYLTATGADTASIVVTVHGRRIELDLKALRNIRSEHNAI
jgi:DNA-binding XRE family transcriptional regulator